MQPQDIKKSNVLQNAFSNYMSALASASAMQNQSAKNLQDSIKGLSDEVGLYYDKKDYQARLAAQEAKEQERYEYERNYREERDKKADEQMAKNYDLHKAATEAQIARSQEETKSLKFNRDLGVIKEAISAGIKSNEGQKMVGNFVENYAGEKINKDINFRNAFGAEVPTNKPALVTSGNKDTAQVSNYKAGENKFYLR